MAPLRTALLHMVAAGNYQDPAPYCAFVVGCGTTQNLCYCLWFSPWLSSFVKHKALRLLWGSNCLVLQLKQLAFVVWFCQGSYWPSSIVCLLFATQKDPSLSSLSPLSLILHLRNCIFLFCFLILCPECCWVSPNLCSFLALLFSPYLHLLATFCPQKPTFYSSL